MHSGESTPKKDAAQIGRKRGRAVVLQVSVPARDDEEESCGGDKVRGCALSEPKLVILVEMRSEQ